MQHFGRDVKQVVRPLQGYLLAHLHIYLSFSFFLFHLEVAAVAAAAAAAAVASGGGDSYRKKSLYVCEHTLTAYSYFLSSGEE